MKFNFYIPYEIKDFYYKIKCFFFPRNKWLTKVIPREYKDKDTLIEIVLFKCLTEYVETEIGKEVLFDKDRWKEDKSFGKAYNEAMKFQVKFEEELKEIYLISTKTIPDLEKRLEKEWKTVPHRSLDEIINSKNDDSTKNDDYSKIYGKIDKYEIEITELKTSVLVWICNNRNAMWT